MYTLELYAEVRRAVFVDGLSQREAARRFGIRTAWYWKCPLSIARPDTISLCYRVPKRHKTTGIYFFINCFTASCN
jgi:hypothetical protein